MRKIDRQLLAAAKKGDAEKLLALLGEGTDVNTDDDQGGTALHYAAEKNRLPALARQGERVRRAHPHRRDRPAASRHAQTVGAG